MTDISFYLFEHSPERQAYSACRLCRKILKQPKKSGGFVTILHNKNS